MSSTEQLYWLGLSELIGRSLSVYAYGKYIRTVKPVIRGHLFAACAVKLFIFKEHFNAV